MQIRALLYFDELVRARSIRAAADKLNIQPTALSRQIDALEHFFGTPLVERTSRGVRLTAAGELVAGKAGRTLREFDHVRQLIEDLKGLKRGHVSICASGATVANLLAPALAEFSIEYPEVRIEVKIVSAREALDALDSAETDLAVTLFSDRRDATSVRASAEITYDVIAASGHPATRDQTIAIETLSRFPIAVPDRSFGARKAFDRLFSGAGYELEPTFVTSSLEMLKELVLRGAAVTLLPELTVLRECRAGLLAAIPVRDVAPVTTRIDLCVAADRTLSFAASGLLTSLECFMQREMTRKTAHGV